MHQKGFAPLLVLLIIGILIAIIAVSYSIIKPKSLQQLQLIPDQKQTAQPEEKEVVVEVEYVNREKIFETVKIPDDSDSLYYTFDFYKVGTIKTGKYKDGDLVLASVIGYGACKSRACRRPLRLRYIHKDNQAIFLPKISSKEKLYVYAEIDLYTTNPFQKFGLSLTSDSEFTIPALEYPEKLTGPKVGQTLNLLEFREEEDGELDQTKLVDVFEHNVFGTVYTTKPELAPTESFYSEGLGLRYSADDRTVEGCVGENCFYTNAFYVFRPDGTFLKYSYTPPFPPKGILPFSPEEVLWSDNKSAESNYLSHTIAGCSRDAYDYNSVVSPSLVSEEDIVIIGEKRNTGEPVYGLKNNNHEFYTEFYNNYEEYFAGPNIYPEEKRQIKSFNEFIDSRPIFFWRDPFGRLIRFNNDDFLPPHACEPIIYLYPEYEQEIDVKLGANVNITDSSPNYQEGWKVLANPSGEIQNISDNSIYPYLFWEGWSYIFPLQESGFVVKQSEVEEFFNETLPKLGLNKKETSDFLGAWMPYFSDSPYYFITFIDQEVIDKIAPLEIVPKPDTVIRILMDYESIEEPIVVPELEIQDIPEREGFTLVEWGGLRR